MTTYELLAREKKATALADVLEEAHIDSALAMEIDAVDWIAVANAARVNPPSVVSIQAVIEILREREKRDMRRAG